MFKPADGTRWKHRGSLSQWDSPSVGHELYKMNGNPSNSCWDISVWTKVVDWPGDIAIPTAMSLTWLKNTIFWIRILQPYSKSHLLHPSGLLICILTGCTSVRYHMLWHTYVFMHAVFLSWIPDAFSTCCLLTLALIRVMWNGLCMTIVLLSCSSMNILFQYITGVVWKPYISSVI